jgi:hypothetical protein
MPLGARNILSAMCKESKRHHKCISPTRGTFINYVFYFIGPSILLGGVFHCSHDLRASILRIIYGLLSFVSYNTFGPLAPSSHEMRYRPFLGQ